MSRARVALTPDPSPKSGRGEPRDGREEAAVGRFKIRCWKSRIICLGLPETACGRRAVGTGDVPVVPPNFVLPGNGGRTFAAAGNGANRAALSTSVEGRRFGAGSRVVFACLGAALSACGACSLRRRATRPGQSRCGALRYHSRTIRPGWWLQWPSRVAEATRRAGLSRVLDGDVLLEEGLVERDSRMAGENSCHGCLTVSGTERF